ncbi:MAG: hypothetical protein JSS86_00870 [Cyanobacteria bacterium SZAS LIN-2]|nr:hypothetical protein [Cyanobacteria bacterium SZAS LIN-2]
MSQSTSSSVRSNNSHLKLSAILAPIVAANARRAALESPKPAAAKRHYDNIRPLTAADSSVFVAPYDVN